jgi:hypothetical protein
VEDERGESACVASLQPRSGARRAYDGRLLLTRAGEYRVSVCLGGEHVGNSPWALTARAC